MKTERLEVDAALKQGLTLPFALVRSLSRVTLGPAPESVDPEELLEARFFDRQEEIRVFPGEDGLRAIRLRTEPDDLVWEESRPLMNPVFGTQIILCHDLAFDEDGQVSITSTRLGGWKGGGV